MKKNAFLLFFCVIFCCDLISEDVKEPKTLILIIATDDKPVYREQQRIWQAYMNSDPKHFEAYFIRANPDLPTPYEIKKNEIIVKTKEGLSPGIINKTIMSMEALQGRLDEFDYILRTNLSSFFPYKNLKNHIEKLPKENCYSGISMYNIAGWEFSRDLVYVPFISGAAIIFSKDVVKLLIKEHGKLEEFKEKIPDDVFIGLFCHKNKIPFKSAQRWDYPTHAGWLENNHKIEDYAYHFRAKYSYDVRTLQDPYKDELLTLNALLKRYYSITLPESP